MKKQSGFILLLLILGLMTCVAVILKAQYVGTINGTPGQSVSFLQGTSVTMGGSLMVAGTPVTTTVTVSGAQLGMGCVASPATGTLQSGTWIDCYVSATNTVTARLMAVLAVTPTSQTYIVRILQ